MSSYHPSAREVEIISSLPPDQVRAYAAGVRHCADLISRLYEQALSDPDLREPLPASATLGVVNRNLRKLLAFFEEYACDPTTEDR